MTDNGGRLHGKVALVTGGGNGIGRAICVLFAREGARLAIVDVDEVAMQETSKLLKHDGYILIKCDVTNADDVKRAFLMSEKEFGQRCDIVANNVGIVGHQNFVSNIQEESFDKVINVNLKGVFLVAKEFLNSVKALDTPIRGVLINMSSRAGKYGLIANGEYSASKAGVIALTRSIANEFNIHRVRCNSVLPGIILETSIADGVDTRLLMKPLDAIPMQRYGKPEEVAHAFLYLASDESSYVHGTCLEISGGA